jgi:hypothetical protein
LNFGSVLNLPRPPEKDTILFCWNCEQLEKAGCWSRHPKEHLVLFWERV